MGEPVDHAAALRSARQRFLSTFPDRLRAITGLVDSLAGDGGAERAESLRHAVHQMSGLSGLIGFPQVGERARALEALLLDPASATDVSAIAAGVQALRDAMDVERTAPEPDWWGPPSSSPPSKGRVLIVEDDAEQRAIIGSAVRGSGYEVVEAERGDQALAAARAHRPSVILLDIDLPGLDGLSVCRQLRTDADLRTTAIVFATARGSALDRGAGLALGADDYIVKPIDSGDLLLRLDLALRRRASAQPVEDGVADYPAFAAGASVAVAEGPAALALVRVPRRQSEVIAALSMNLRRRDRLGRFDGRHLIVLMPGVSARAAADRLRPIVAEAAGPDGEFQVGVAASTDEAGHTLDALIAIADDALDRREPSAAAAPRMVLVAEDEPDISRLIDSQLRAAGYRTQVVHDGRRAAEAIRSGGTDAAVLDLMLPGLSGFDVLAGTRLVPSRPRVVVVSGRGREVDVTRAFDLGADDYIMKPFSPQELLARLARLLR